MIGAVINDPKRFYKESRKLPRVYRKYADHMMVPADSSVRNLARADKVPRGGLRGGGRSLAPGNGCRDRRPAGQRSLRLVSSISKGCSPVTAIDARGLRRMARGDHGPRILCPNTSLTGYHSSVCEDVQCSCREDTDTGCAERRETYFSTHERRESSYCRSELKKCCAPISSK